MQAHYSNGIALNFRNSETARNMGFNLKDDVESYSFRTFTKEMFLDSETAMVVISGVPGKEESVDSIEVLRRGVRVIDPFAQQRIDDDIAGALFRQDVFTHEGGE